METFQKMITGGVFFIVATMGLLIFALAYPESNGYESILNKDPNISSALSSMNISASDYNTQANTEKNILINTTPDVSGEGIQLVSEVSIAGTQWNRVTEGLNIVYVLTANLLGVSGSTLAILLGALFSLITIIFGLLLFKLVRVGY